MAKQLAPYGSADHTGNLAKVGKSKTPSSLVARMPSAEIMAKVGGPVKTLTPASLVARMPSAELAAKVGSGGISVAKSHRVVRRNRQA